MCNFFLITNFKVKSRFCVLFYRWGFLAVTQDYYVSAKSYTRDLPCICPRFEIVHNVKLNCHGEIGSQLSDFFPSYDFLNPKMKTSRTIPFRDFLKAKSQITQEEPQSRYISFPLCIHLSKSKRNNRIPNAMRISEDIIVALPPTRQRNTKMME